MPKDLVEQARTVQEAHKRNPLFTQAKVFHPICYTTFAHLRIIIDRRWEDFKDTLAHKDAILGDLQKLEYFRNAVAHNRPIQEKEYRVLAEISSRFMYVLKEAKQEKRK